MTIILCTDSQNGMAFNHRRQSRDREVINDIVNSIQNKKIYMSPYSLPLFDGTGLNIAADENYIDIADDGSFCFVEREALMPYINRISTLVIYNWNKIYPSDMKLDIDKSNVGKLISTTEIKGYSHDKIIKEIYEV